MSKNLNMSKQLPVALILLGFFLTGLYLSFYPNFDPDFWWHLRTGQEIIESGQIPRTDSYSFTMPDYPYIYHSWLSQILIYFIYGFSGHNGITLLYSSAVVMALILLTYRSKTPLPMVVGLALLFPILTVTGLRTQSLSFLGIGLLLGLINWIEEYKKQLKITPSLAIATTALSLIWANLHPGFVMGLALLAGYLLYQLLQPKPKLSYQQAGVLWGLPAIATLINPFGPELHQFVLQMSQNPTAAMYNQDWIGYFENPVFSTFHKTLILLWSGLAIYLSRGYRRIVVLVLLLATAYSTRFAMPLMVSLVWAIPTVIDWIQKHPALKGKQKSLSKLSLLVLGLLVFNQYSQFHATLAAHQDDSSHALASRIGYNYPYDAIQHLRDLPGENVFNYYDWGGYLIYHLPEKRVFIDGRMDNFYLEDGQSFMAVEKQILHLRPGWEEVFESYSVDYVLLPSSEPLVDQLLNRGWQVVYEDEVSLLLKQP